MATAVARPVDLKAGVDPKEDVSTAPQLRMISTYPCSWPCQALLSGSYEVMYEAISNAGRLRTLAMGIGDVPGRECHPGAGTCRRILNFPSLNFVYVY
jgi:hypothetical protein